MYTDNDIIVVESKASNISTVEIQISRDSGLYGEVSVSWRVAASQGQTVTDLSPINGSVVFSPDQNTGSIIISSVPDQV